MTGRARWNVSLILHIYVTYPWGKELTDSISTGRGETVKVIGGILPLCQFSLVTSGAQGFPLDISHLPPWGWSLNLSREQGRLSKSLLCFCSSLVGKPFVESH